MPTIESGLLEFLTARGLFQEQAISVLQELRLEPGMDGLRLSDTEAAFPPMMAVLRLRACFTAVKWIDREMPTHWARPMFADLAAN